LKRLIVLALLLLAACGAQQQPLDPAQKGERLFRTLCLGCHGVRPDAPEVLGPNLAGIATRAASNPDGLSAEAWLRREIVDPNAVITPGFQPNLMPQNYGQQLSTAEIDALVAYMLTLE
jgi:mono/diheme cytochrome c family protein